MTVVKVGGGGVQVKVGGKSDCPPCPPGGDVTITNQNGGTVAVVAAPGSYPVFVFDTIQNSLTSDSVIINTI